jgi:hypothetical protein
VTALVTPVRTPTEREWYECPLVGLGWPADLGSRGSGLTGSIKFTPAVTTAA